MTGLTKKWDTANEFTSLIGKHKQSEAKRLAAEFNTIIEKLIELNKRNPMPSWRAKFTTVMVKIDKSELAEMDEARIYKKRAVCPFNRKKARKWYVSL